MESEVNKTLIQQQANTQISHTVDSLNQLIAQNRQNVKVGVWGYVVLSLVFPPFTTIWAFYKASKKQVLSFVLPAITIVFSVLILLSAVSSGASVQMPTQLTNLGIDSQTGINSTVMSLIRNITIFLSLVGLILGIYFRQKVKKINSLSSLSTWIMIAVIFLQMFAIGFLFYFVYKSLYSSIAPIIQSNQTL